MDTESATNHELITKPVLLITLLLISTQAPPRAQSPTQTWVDGRCAGCRFPFQLGRIQFVTPTEGWATGFVIQVTEAHASQMSTILHTTDGGRTWKPVKHWETYGMEIEPAFWFVDARHGWSAWPVASDGSTEMLRTTDGGRRWHKIDVKDVNDEAAWTHLRATGTGTWTDASALLRRPAGGQVWTRLSQAGFAKPNTHINAVRFLSDQIGFVFIDDVTETTAGGPKTSGPAVLATRDGGLSWTRTAIKAPVTSCQVVGDEVWCSAGMNILKLKP